MSWLKNAVSKVGEKAEAPAPWDRLQVQHGNGHKTLTLWLFNIAMENPL